MPLDPAPTTLPRDAGPSASRGPVALPTLQVLRAVAATMVLVVHLPFASALMPPGVRHAPGHAGVDLFFVLSGFLMVHTTRPRADGRRIGPRDFLARRIARVVPLYWAMTTLLVALALGPAAVRAPVVRPEMTEWPAVLASYLFVPYRINGAVEPTLYVGWTLNYEMVFYLLFGLSLLVARERLRVALVVAVLVGLVVVGALTSPEQTALAFYTRELLLQFAFGALAAALLPWALARVGALGPAATLALRAVIVLGLLWIFAHTARVDDVHSPLTAGLPAAAVVTAAAALDLRGRSWAAPALVIAGEASYALYLSHPLVIRYLRTAMPHGVPPAPASALLTALTVVVVWLVALVLWRWIDVPLSAAARRWLHAGRSTRPRPQVTAGGTATSPR